MLLTLPAATGGDLLKAVAKKQGWQPADDLLRLEGASAAPGNCCRLLHPAPLLDACLVGNSPAHSLTSA
jgi:hypothetical protein